MYIYFVRHGQTPSNIEHRFQTAETPLAASGEEQALQLAERLSKLQFSEIWSSPMKRALQTAEFINQYQKVTISIKENLREIKRGKELEGKIPSDPSIAHFQGKHWENVDDPYYKTVPDSESVAEALARTQQFCQQLVSYGQDKPLDFHLCVVSHGITLSILLVGLLAGKLATPELVRTTLKNLKMQNTGVSVVKLEKGHFQILTINDFAHL